MGQRLYSVDGALEGGAGVVVTAGFLRSDASEKTGGPLRGSRKSVELSREGSVSQSKVGRTGGGMYSTVRTENLACCG